MARMIAALVVITGSIVAYGPATITEAADQSHAGIGRVEHVHALAFAADGRSLWLGTHTALFRSGDTGRTWTKITLPLKRDGVDVMAVTAHPTDAATMYVGTHEAGVLKTSDGGRTWASVNQGLGGHDIHGLAIDPNTPTKLHAVVRDQRQGVYRTQNAGQRWTRVDDGPGGETKVLTSVNVATGMGGIFLYAGTAEGLQRSPDCF